MSQQEAPYNFFASLKRLGVKNECLLHTIDNLEVALALSFNLMTIRCFLTKKVVADARDCVLQTVTVFFKKELYRR